MKTILYNRIKKWMLFALIGSIAYFAGYFLGQRSILNKSSDQSLTMSSPNTGVE